MDELEFTQSENYGMGTVINNKVFGRQAAEALQEVLSETIRLEQMLSRFIPDSEISRINSTAGIGYEKVSNETYNVISRAIEFSRCCQGFFDITIGPLASLWSNAKEERKPPVGEVIRKVLPFVNYTDLVLKPEEEVIGLRNQGQLIDLGGIAKGFAADMILKVYQRYGITSAFTNFGGNVAVLGAKPDGTPWRIGIRHPRLDNGLIGSVSMINKSVVTSGDYQRFFYDSSGRRYHHILNPKTGYPSESGLISVTIIADSSMDADALSTIIFLLGRNKGSMLLKSFPGTEAILIDTDLTVYITRGLENNLQTVEGIGINILN